MLPVTAWTLLVMGLGLEAEWTDGCARLIRPVGHAGLFLSFVAASLVEHRVAKTVVSTMSLSLAVLWRDDVLLLPSALFMMQDCYVFETVAMAASLYCLDVGPLHRSDAFAHAGHITLLASSAGATQSPVFLLACGLAAAYGALASDRLQLSTALVVAAAASFASTTFAERPGEDRLGCARSLWQCRHGRKTTVVVALYCIALYAHSLGPSCGDHTSDDLVLHALHVGGVFAVVVFIFPQVSPSCFGYVKCIICLAATSDALVCAFRTYAHAIDPIGVVRAVASAATALGVARAEAPPVNDALAAPVKRRAHPLRYVAVAAYVAISFASQALVGPAAVLLSFSYVTHTCFIIGGLAFESVHSNDLLTTRLTQVLLCSELVAYSSWVGLGGVRVQTAVDAFKVVTLLLALPTALVPYEGVLSFRMAQDFEAVV